MLVKFGYMALFLLFQIGGLHRCHRKALSCQPFTKLPARLCFRLRNLLPFPDESMPQDGMGYVFMSTFHLFCHIINLTLTFEAAKTSQGLWYIWNNLSSFEAKTLELLENLEEMFQCYW